MRRGVREQRRGQRTRQSAKRKESEDTHPLLVGLHGHWLLTTRSTVKPSVTEQEAHTASTQRNPYPPRDITAAPHQRMLEPSHSESEVKRGQRRARGAVALTERTSVFHRIGNCMDCVELSLLQPQVSVVSQRVRCLKARHGAFALQTP
jgi:hypothetical protein